MVLKLAIDFLLKMNGEKMNSSLRDQFVEFFHFKFELIDV